MRKSLAPLLAVLVLAVFVALHARNPLLRAEPPPVADFHVKNKIDTLILQRLKSEKIEPSALCTDEEFARRVYLDVCGAIPSSLQLKQFLADRRADKREQLVDRLLQSPRFAESWSVLWSDLLRDNSNSQAYHNWIRQALARNMAYDEFTRRLIAASGNTDDNPATFFHLRDQGNNVEQVNTVATVFMGTRMACAQCHDHPFDKWTQDDFHGLMAFFARTTVEDDTVARLLKVEAQNDLPAEARAALQPYFVEAHMGELRTQLLNSRQNHQRYPETGAVLDQPIIPRRDILKELETQFTEEKKDPKEAKELLAAIRKAFDQHQSRMVVERSLGDYRLPNEGDGISKKHKGDEIVPAIFAWDPSRRWDGAGSRRKPLAEFITGTRQFAAVQVNRMWAQVMGRGLVTPVDDFREKNPPTHPELLEYLTDEFIASKFDNRHMLRLILTSSTYQLSSESNTSNRSDTTLYSHRRARRMSAEQAYDSILVATGHDNRVDSENAYLKDTAPPDGSMLLRRPPQPEKRVVGPEFAEDVRVPAQTGSFLNLFNQPDREQTATHRDEGTSIPQVLELMNGHLLNDAIRNSPLAKTLSSVDLTPRQIASELYLSTFGREPHEAELALLFKIAPPDADSAKLRAWIEDMYWALLNSPEFTYVH
jgi:hypothetical protein